MMPDFLSHYYERERGPFRNLSDLPLEQAEAILGGLRQSGDSFASKRASDYLQIRRRLEAHARVLFIEKGGRPVRRYPHSMILGACEWVKSWYKEGCELRIPLSQFNPATISFTYGDIFPAMRLGDGKPYRGQVYTLDELPDLISEFGLPQVWNADGAHGPDRYIEAQVWADEPLSAYYRPPLP